MKEKEKGMKNILIIGLRGWQSPVITKIILIGAPDPNWMTTEMKK